MIFDRKLMVSIAGRKSHFLSRFPVSFSLLIDNPKANWCYRSEPEPSTNHRAIPIPRGKLLGGSSAINGLVYVRGHQLDYDTWGQLGNRGWSYNDVLPLFKRIESYDSGESLYRGRAGPLVITQAPDSNPIYDQLFKAGKELKMRVDRQKIESTSADANSTASAPFGPGDGAVGDAMVAALPEDR